MSDFFKNVEQIIKHQSDEAIEHLMHYHGMEVEIYRAINKDVYSRVHGPNAGDEGTLLKKIKVMLTSDDFFTYGDKYSGSFVQGFMYSDDKTLLAGDTVKVVSLDGKLRRYKIERLEGIGDTMEVFERYVLSSMGD